MFKPSRKRLAELVYLRILDDVVLWNDSLYSLRNSRHKWYSTPFTIETATKYRDNDANRLARIGRYRRQRGWM